MKTKVERKKDQSQDQKMEAKRERRAKRPAKAEIDSLTAFHLLARWTNGFIVSLSQWQPNGDATIGISEWAILRLFEKDEPMAGRQIAKALGVTRQRMKQLTDKLLEQQFIKVVASGEGKASSYVMTRDGARARKDFDATLSALLDGGKVDSKRLLRIAGSLRRVSKVIFQKDEHKDDDAVANAAEAEAEAAE